MDIRARVTHYAKILNLSFNPSLRDTWADLLFLTGRRDKHNNSRKRTLKGRSVWELIRRDRGKDVGVAEGGGGGGERAQRPKGTIRESFGVSIGVLV